MDEIDICIDKLLKSGGEKANILSTSELKAILSQSRDILLSQNMYLKLRAPIAICGDVHGQFRDLLTIFKLGGKPGRGKQGGRKYLFLGDYVDRGKNSIELMALLLAYKIKYPLRIFLLRGNHECEKLTYKYGFYDECKRKYTVKIWKKFVDVFNVMPIAASVNKSIFCCHGGISPYLKDIKQIAMINRPTVVPSAGLMADLLWSDPRNVKRWTTNNRGAGWYFGPEQIECFLRKFSFTLIARAHEVKKEGYERFAQNRLITIFSAPDYEDKKNKGAFMLVDKTLKCTMIDIPWNYNK